MLEIVEILKGLASSRERVERRNQEIAVVRDPERKGYEVKK